jgi:rhomboid protease GluP
MPKHEQTIALGGLETDIALSLALKALQNLQWPVALATDTVLVGNTPRNWKTYGQQIVIMADNGSLTVKSEMVNGESLDLGKRNSKNVAAFMEEWGALRFHVADLSEQRQALADLRQQTAVAIQQEEKETAEVDAVMNLSKSNLYVTYAIMAINILVFALMALNGAGIIDANGLVHLRWGSNFAPLTLSGDWWRLISCTFLHFGIIHLAMNMYSLYMVGIYLEPMLGKVRYVAAYLATGVLASVASLWWHTEPTNSAGASGAVFGMYGVFLALLTTNLIPKQVRQSLLGSIGVFVAYNLFYGMKGGVDNAAHIGGLLSGIAIGYLYALSIKKEKEGREPMRWAAGAVAVAACVGAFLYLQQNKASNTERQKIVNEIADISYKDNDVFNTKLGEFDDLQKKVFALLDDDNITQPHKKQKITDSIMPIWDKLGSVLESAKKLNVSPASKTKADQLLQYVALRKSQMQTLLEMTEKGEQQPIIERFTALRDSAEKIFEEAVK